MYLLARVESRTSLVFGSSCLRFSCPVLSNRRASRHHTHARRATAMLAVGRASIFGGGIGRCIAPPRSGRAATSAGPVRSGRARDVAHARVRVHADPAPRLVAVGRGAARHICLFTPRKKKKKLWGLIWGNFVQTYWFLLVFGKENDKEIH